MKAIQWRGGQPKKMDPAVLPFLSLKVDARPFFLVVRKPHYDAKTGEEFNRTDEWSQDEADGFASDLSAKICAEGLGLNAFEIVSFPQGVQVSNKRPEAPQRTLASYSIK